MELQSKSMMARPSATNGFTLIQVLFVMLIVSVLALSIPTDSVNSLQIFSKMIQMRCIQVQEKAFSTKEVKSVIFLENKVIMDDTEIKFGKNISCQPNSFHYNEHGNISEGGHVTCQKEGKEIHFIFQIGTGRVRIES